MRLTGSEEVNSQGRTKQHIGLKLQKPLDKGQRKGQPLDKPGGRTGEKRAHCRQRATNMEQENLKRGLGGPSANPTIMRQGATFSCN